MKFKYKPTIRFHCSAVWWSSSYAYMCVCVYTDYKNLSKHIYWTLKWATQNTNDRQTSTNSKSERKVTIMKRKINIENHFLNERKRTWMFKRAFQRANNEMKKKKNTYSTILGMNQFCVFTSIIQYSKSIIRKSSRRSMNKKIEWCDFVYGFSEFDFHFQWNKIEKM